MPIIMLIVAIGAFAIDNQMTSVVIMIVAGLFGFVLDKAQFDAAPMVLGMVIGPILESSFRRSLIISSGNPSIFFTRLGSLIMIAVTAAILVGPVMSSWLRDRFRATRPT